MTTQASLSVCFCSVRVPLGGCLSHLQVCDEAFCHFRCSEDTLYICCVILVKKKGLCDSGIFYKLKGF